MTDFDRRLEAAIDADDAAFLKHLEDERGLFAQMGDTMAGPLGGWARLVFGLTVLLAAALFWSLYQLLTVDGTRETILWATAVLALLFMQAMAKQWLFDRINLNAVLREVKRLELQVARIEEKR